MRSGPVFRPYADICESESEYMVRADLPGSSADAIEVTYESGLLTIQANVEPRRDPAQTRYLLREYAEGDFHRAFRIGEGIDPSAISAEYKNGVLTLHLPKSEDVMPKRIEVKTT
ncbi:MAG: Hsp20/alpha crystallin family protein [Phycisphaerae bacterium]|nr:Hsp20/alpha crystallin family protein [Phycisphaerae bacterium]